VGGKQKGQNKITAIDELIKVPTISQLLTDFCRYQYLYLYIYSVNAQSIVPYYDPFACSKTTEGIRLIGHTNLSIQFEPEVA
jgi:hypothetical protein